MEEEHTVERGGNVHFPLTKQVNWTQVKAQTIEWYLR